MSPYRYIKKVDRVLKNVMQVPPVFWVLPQKQNVLGIWYSQLSQHPSQNVLAVWMCQWKCTVVWREGASQVVLPLLSELRSLIVETGTETDLTTLQQKDIEQHVSEWCDQDDGEVGGEVGVGWSQCPPCLSLPVRWVGPGLHGQGWSPQNLQTPSERPSSQSLLSQENPAQDKVT